MIRLSALGLLVLLLSVGCGESVPSSGVSDAPGRKACGDFAKLLDDVRGGVLQPGELRPAAQKVYDSGRLSKHGKIAEHSTTLLRATTEGPPEDATAAMDGLIVDCGL